MRTSRAGRQQDVCVRGRRQRALTHRVQVTVYSAMRPAKHSGDGAVFADGRDDDCAKVAG